MRAYRPWLPSAILFAFFIVQSGAVTAEKAPPATPVAAPPILSLKMDRADAAQLPCSFRRGSDDDKGATKTGVIPGCGDMAATTAQASDYSGYLWRIDAPAGDAKALPRNFRTADSAFKEMDDQKKVGVDPSDVPSRAGLNSLPISGSAEFSVPAFHAMLPVLRAKAAGDIYIVDLRQESHGFMNDMAVSWYGGRNWGNLNKTRDEVIRDENARIHAAKGRSLIVAALDKDKMPIDPKPVRIDSAMTERELVEGAGLRYVRFAVTDHTWAKPETIDAFVDFVKNTPSNSWMHFHCQAGKGRTTSFMVMYDMMKNPSVPLKDILHRQYLLGGAYLAYDPSMSHPTKSWKDDYDHVKACMVAKFYEYVQQNHADHYAVPWSVWLKQRK